MPDWIVVVAAVYGPFALWMWSKMRRECSPKRICAYHRRVGYGWPTPGMGSECRGWATKRPERRTPVA